MRNGLLIIDSPRCDASASSVSSPILFSAVDNKKSDDGLMFYIFASMLTITWVFAIIFFIDLHCIFVNF